MTLVFALVTYLGTQQVDISYFRNIDDCRYFAYRINNQAGVPGGSEGKLKFYKATCKPAKVDPSKTPVHQ
jgi:hypothetical protein